MAQLDRSTPPPPGPAPEIKLSDYASFELPNGLKVFVVENHKLPVVSFTLVVDRDPILEGKNTGYIDMAGQLLRTGTKTRTKDQIDEEIDFIGASLSTSSTGVVASSLKKHMTKLLEIMSDVVVNPAFRQEELDKIKTQTLSGLAASKDEPGTIAGRLVQALYYGKDHPYSEFETEETVGNITLDMCSNYYSSFFKPNISYLAVVGDVTQKEIEPLIKTYFGSWQKGEVRHFTYPQPQPPAVTKVAIVDRPNSVQSSLRIGYPVDLKTGSDDAVKASVTNTILGGGVFRLFKNLREKHAYTYGAYSRIASDKLVGSFTAYADVKNAVTDSAVTQILYEMKRIRDEKTDDKELQQAKNYTSGNFAIALEKPETIARFAINIERYKLPRNYYADYLKHVAEVSSDEVMSMAKKYIHPENAYIIAVGNASEIAGKLKKFSPSDSVNFYDIYAELNNPSTENLPAGVNAQSVLEKYIDALGGRENLQKVTDRVTEMTGKVQGVNVNITIYQKQPNELRQEINAGGTEQKIVFNGKQAFNISPMGKQEITGANLEDLKLEANLNSILDLQKYGITAQLEGVEKINGRDAYKLRMQSSKGKTWTEYYDTSSGLKLRQIKSITAPMGQATQTIDFDNYKEVNGVKYPFKLQQTLGNQKMDMQVTSIKINTGLKDNLFEARKQ